MFELEQSLRSLVPREPLPSCQATLELVPSLRAFDGHFPERPVLPGIIQIGLVRALLERQIGQPLALRSVRRGRMSLLLEPGDLLQIEIKCTPLSELPVGWRARAWIHREKKLAARFTLLLVPQHTV